MSDKRPETCLICGLPKPWCKCTNEEVALRIRIAELEGQSNTCPNYKAPEPCCTCNQPKDTPSTVTKYDYSFYLYPASGTAFSKSLYTYFDYINVRIIFTFTQVEFSDFRFAVLCDGFELHEIERTPFCETETVQ